MTPAAMVLKNLLRRRGRFTLTLSGIAIGIACVVTFLALGGSLKSEIRREASALGANLVVTPKGSCAFEQVSILTGEQLPTTITMEEVRSISAIPGIIAVPYLTEKTAINNRPVAVVGILPEATLPFKEWSIDQGRYFTEADKNGVVIGAVVASQFGLAPGKEVTVRGEALPILGVLAATGSKDDLTIFAPLPLAQRLFQAEERASFVAVRVADLDQVESYALKIREATGLGVVSDQQMLKSVLSIVGSVNVTLQLIAAVAVLAAAFGIVNTMLTATYERRREIGILQAMGATRRTIFTLFLCESGLYGILGGIAGVGLGLVASVLVAPHVGQNAFSAFVKSSSGGGGDPVMIASCIGLSAAVAILSGLYPAWRAAQLSPVEAINHD
jgi:putative ABC transport system permease protein